MFKTGCKQPVIGLSKNIINNCAQIQIVFGINVELQAGADNYKILESGQMKQLFVPI